MDTPVLRTTTAIALAAVLLVAACDTDDPEAPALQAEPAAPAAVGAAPPEPPRPWALRFVRACASPWASSEVFATSVHVFGCGAIFDRESGALLDVRAETGPLGRLGSATVWRHDDGLVIRSAELHDRHVPLPVRPEAVRPLADGTLLVQSAAQLDVLDPSTGALRRLDGGEACASSVGPLGVSSHGAVQCLARERAGDAERSSLRTLCRADAVERGAPQASGCVDAVELPLVRLARWVPSGERLLAHGGGTARWIADDGEILAEREVHGGWAFLDVAADGAMLIAREDRTELWAFVDGEARVEPVYERRAEAGSFAGGEIVLSSAGSLVWLHRGDPGALASLAAPAPPPGMRALRPDVDGAAATFEGGAAVSARLPNDVAAFESDGPRYAHVVVSRSDAGELSRFADDEGWARMVAARYLEPGDRQWAKHWRGDEGRVLRGHSYIGGCERMHSDVLVRERDGVLERWIVHTGDGEGLEPILGAVPDDARDARLLRDDAYRGDPSIGALP